MSRARDIADLSSVSARLDTLGASSGALSNRNMIINGAMQVAQRGTITGIGASTATVYTACDRFNIYTANSAGRVTASQEAITDLEGFSSALKIQCTTADTSVAANELFILGQRLEGQNVQGIQKGFSTAKEVTVSFYAKANETRVHVLEYYDTDNNRQCSKAFTVTTSWQRFSLTFPADTTGKHDNDNNNSINFMWHLHSGSDLTSGTSNSSSFASATSANRAVGIGSIVASTNNNFFITGVQMEIGDTATDFEHRSFGDELTKCQRYFFDCASNRGAGSEEHIISGAMYDANYMYGKIEFPVTMRTMPSVVQTSGSQYFQIYCAGSSNAIDSLTMLGSGNSNENFAMLRNTQAVSFTAGQAANLQKKNASASVAFDAEL